MAKQPTGRYRPGPEGKNPSRFHSSKESAQLIWSIHPVLEALRVSPGNVKEIILEKDSGSRIETIIALAQKQHVPVRYDKGVFQKGGMIAGERHQGIIARIAFSYIDFDRMMASVADSHDVPFILVLDSIQDPQNLGAIIRSAVAAGCKKLILPKDRSAQITGAVVKTSAGAVFHMDICRVTNLAVTIDALREAGIWVFATAADGPQPIYQADFSVPVCLVIGNEEKGVRPLVKKHCDGLVSIPMAGEIDSLNASVAAGVVLFEIARQRSIGR